MQGNPNVAEIVLTQSVAFDASALSDATQSSTDVITLYATAACWVARGQASAQATPGALNIFVPAGVMITIPILGGDAVAAISDGTAGTLHIYEHENIYP